MDNFDEIMARIMKMADEFGLSRSEGCPELDEEVHDMMSAKASEINNGGLESQVRFILTEMGPDGEKLIRDSIKADEKYDQWVTKCLKCGGSLRVRQVTMSATGQELDLDVPLASDGFEVPEDKYSGKDCSTTDEKVECSDCHERYELYQLDGCVR